MAGATFVSTLISALAHPIQDQDPSFLPIRYRSDESDVARNATVKMFNDLRVAFGELIEEAEWMDRGEREGPYLGRIRPMDLKDPPIQQFLIDFDGSTYNLPG